MRRCAREGVHGSCLGRDQRKDRVAAERGPEKVERGRRWGSAKARGAAERGHGKVERGHRWGRQKLSVVTDGTAGKRSAWLHFCLYRIRIGSHI